MQGQALRFASRFSGQEGGAPERTKAALVMTAWGGHPRRQGNSCRAEGPLRNCLDPQGKPALRLSPRGYATACGSKVTAAGLKAPFGTASTLRASRRYV